MQPADVFAQIKEKIENNADLVNEVGAIFQFDVAGVSGGTWTVDLKNAPGSVSDSENSDADCVISVSEDDFVGIMTGAVDPQMAFMMGRIKVAGNFMLATKLRALM